MNTATDNSTFIELSKLIKIHGLTPSLAAMLLIEQSYGRILSHTTYLDSKHTELGVVISLIQMNTPRQLRNHLNSTKRVGATGDEIKAAEIIGYSVKNAISN